MENASQMIYVKCFANDLWTNVLQIIYGQMLRQRFFFTNISASGTNTPQGFFVTQILGS